MRSIGLALLIDFSARASPNATVTSVEQIINKTEGAEHPPKNVEKPGDIVFKEGNKTTVVDPNETMEPDEEIEGLSEFYDFFLNSERKNFRLDY